MALYHTNRLASPGQRIVLYAKDWVSHPGCHVPGYHSEVHHVTDYSTVPQHRRQRLDPGLRPHTAWSNPAAGAPANTTRGHRMDPPPHLDRGQPRTNTFQHPERLLRTKRPDDEKTTMKTVGVGPIEWITAPCCLMPHAESDSATGSPTMTSR